MWNSQWFNLVSPPNPREQELQPQQQCHGEGDVQDYSDLDVELCVGTVSDLGTVVIEGGLRCAVRGRGNV